MRHRIIAIVLISCVVWTGCALQPSSQETAEAPEHAAETEQHQPPPEVSDASESVNNQALQKIDALFDTLPEDVTKPVSSQPEAAASKPSPEAASPSEPRIGPVQSAPPASFQIVETDLQTLSSSQRSDAFTTDNTEETPQAVGLNFDNADIRDVTKVVSEITGKSFIVDQDVEGTVTIYSEKALTPDQVFDLFKSVLELNGLAITRVGDFYKIVRSENAQKRYLTVDTGKTPAEDDRLITQIIKLKYANAQEVKESLESFTSSEIIVYPDPETGNTLIITDLASNVRKLLQIVREMDVSQYANRYVEIFPVRYANLPDLIDDLTQILSIPGAAGPLTEITEQPTQPEPTTPETETEQPVSPIVPPGTETNLHAISRLNALMVSTNQPDVITLVEKWVNILDQPAVNQLGETTDPNQQTQYFYHVKYAKAEELAELLARVYAEGLQAPQEPTQPEQPNQPDQQQQIPDIETNPEEPAPVFIADSTTNLLIIKATPIQYADQIKPLLDQLDHRPFQVLIEVIIAEVTLSDNDVFGVQGMLMGQDQITVGSETNAVSATAETAFSGIVGDDLTGFSYAVNAPGRFLAQLRALATKSRVKVLSDPHILVRNNQEAKINIGDSIPIKTVKGEGETAEETIEYKETGIILTVTPQVNYESDVVMEIVQEVSSPGTKEAGDVAPPINKTVAQTSLVTRDGHPLVIGGLINTRESKSQQGVPLLKDIPLLGRLFRYKEQQDQRKELLILVTPRIVRTPEQGWNVTDDVLKKRIRNLEQLFNREPTDAEKVKQFLKNSFRPE